MNPAVCYLCKKYAMATPDPDRGDWVEFANYEAPQSDGPIDHPQGLEWFCSEHSAAAQLLSHLTAQEALSDLQRRFGMFAAPG